MQPRRIARELALLSQSQLSANPEKVQQQKLEDFVVAAVRTLTSESHDALETSSAELKRGSDRLMGSVLHASTVESARAMVYEAIELTQSAINRLAMAVEIPEFIQLSNRKEVRAHTLEILSCINANRSAIDEVLNKSMVDWQLNRLPRIDQDILRIAVAEMYYLGIPAKVAINEAVEMAKRYSGDEGYRFINGVLRRVSENMKEPTASQ